MENKRIGRADALAAIREAERLVARQLALPARRAFLRRGLTLGGLAMLSGCTVEDGTGVERALSAVSRLNDRVQAALFDPAALAPTYPDSMITRPFPFNAFHGEDEVPDIDTADWRLEVAGRVESKTPWTLAQLMALPLRHQVTRHICVEGWSAIGKWGGVPFSVFLHFIGADLGAKFVGFECADGYSTSIDMPTALHAQTLLAWTYDGQLLPAKYGHPVKLRIPTKLGYKNPKHITTVFVSNENPGGYWEDQGYNWFGGS